MGRKTTSSDSDLEMQGDQREDKRLEVLHEVIEDTKTFRILRLVHVHQRSYLGGLARKVSVE